MICRCSNKGKIRSKSVFRMKRIVTYIGPLSSPFPYVAPLKVGFFFSLIVHQSYEMVIFDEIIHYDESRDHKYVTLTEFHCRRPNVVNH